MVFALRNGNGRTCFLKMAGCWPTRRFPRYWIWFRNARQIPPRRATACNTQEKTAGGRWEILNKSSNSCRTSQQKCWHIDCFRRFQTSHLVWYQTKIPGNATIVTTPRQEEILDAARLDGCSSQLSPFSINQSTMQKKQSMEEASSSWSPKESGEGRIELKIQFQTQPPLCISYAHIL